jgi:beta-lactamase class D
VKVLLTALLLGVLLTTVSRAEVVCTLLVNAQSGAVRLEEGGGCETPAAPASTFKVPLALMGYDAGILTGPLEPAMPYRAEYNGTRAEEKVTVNPTSWLRDSVLWYSRQIVAGLGAERFASYVSAFQYGNADVSGDRGKNNGLTRSWLNSSLKLSPTDQVQFLRRMLAGDLPVSAAAVDSTIAIMPSFSAGAWDVHGKTGTYYERNADGTYNTSRQWGWFVGWADRGDDRVVFAYLIRDAKKTAGPAGLRARDALLARFVKWGGQIAWRSPNLVYDRYDG